jgi:hypothetical protein
MKTDKENREQLRYLQEIFKRQQKQLDGDVDSE